MPTADDRRYATRPYGARTAARVCGVALAALVAYAAWRGYQQPDFLLAVATAFGLC
jgi:hypothetical protein